jgi:hypothetical protein
MRCACRPREWSSQNWFNAGSKRKVPRCLEYANERGVSAWSSRVAQCKLMFRRASAIAKIPFP